MGVSLLIGTLDVAERKNIAAGKVIAAVAVLRAKLEGRIRSTFDVTEGVAQLIQVDGAMSADHFFGMSKQALEAKPLIRRILFAPNDVVQLVYPVAGNEGVLGMNIQKIQIYREAVLRARDAKEAILAGPVELSLKRGVGFIYRRPVFLNAGEVRGGYWGSISVVADMQHLLVPVSQKEASGLQIAVRGTDGLGFDGGMIIGDPLLFEEHPITSVIDIPGGTWQLGALPVNGWPSDSILGSILFQGSVLCTVLLTIFSARLCKSQIVIRLRHAELSKEVEVRRAAESSLKQSEKRFRSLFERSPDPTLILGEGGFCTQANASAREVFGYDDMEIFSTIKAKDISPPFQSDGQSTEVKARLMLQVAIKTGVHRFEWLHKRADGSIFPAEITLCTMTLAEKPALYAVVRDITARKEAEHSLSIQQDLLQNIVENAPSLIYIYDTEGRLQLCNRLFEQAAGFKFEEMKGKQRDDFLSIEETKTLNKNDKKVLAAKGIVRFEDRLKRDGQVRVYLTTKCVLRAKDGKPTGILGISTDITETKQKAEQLRLAGVVISHTADGVVITNSRGHILSINAAYEKITGYSLEDSIGHKPSMLISENQDRVFYQNILKNLKNGGFWRGELWNRRRDGALYPMWMTINTVHNEEGKITNYVGVFSDVSAINQSLAELEQMSHFDPVTALPNRTLFHERLQHSLELSKNTQLTIAVMVLDLDGFKTVNDSLGHSIGDLLLKQASSRFLSCVRSGDTVSRIGGDEFALILNDLRDPADAIIVSEKLLSSFKKPFSLQGANILLTASIGISVSPQDSQTPEQLLKQADSAMYGAKESGRNNYRFYQPEMTQRAQQRLDSEYALRRAVQNKEFEIWYQPKINLSTHTLVGAEALIRWRDPVRGLVPPTDFIPLAEQTGLITDIGEFAIETVCKDIRRWTDHQLNYGVVAVNVASLQIERSDLLEVIKGFLEAYVLPAKSLEIEVTESLMMANPEHTKIVLRQLQRLGITTAIDDFGTGYSSLAYLKMLPINSLKIDRAFVSGLPHDSVDRAIVKTIVDLGHALGFKVVAEGVETEEQHSFLKDSGCDVGQGYFYGRPMHIVAFESCLDRLSKNFYTI
jgi:diguanylate cyclase (GGDEF)-like protein/PAS domain S-box-containing protein